MIDTLVMDAATLSALSSRQLHALENFLSGCGQLIAIAMPQEVVAALTENAGCDGKNIKKIQDHNQFANAISDFGKQSNLPSNQDKFHELSRDAIPNNRMLATVTSFFILYLLALLVTRFLSRRPEAVIGVSVASSLLAAIAWSGNTPQISTFTWVEQESGEKSARYSMLFQHIGNGLGQTSIPTPAYLYDPVPLNNQNIAQVPMHLDIRENREPALVMPTALLRQNEFYFDGTIQHDNRISLLNKNGVAQIVNHGDKAIKNAFLLWEGEVINLPVIKPQASWSKSMAREVTHTTDAPAKIIRLLDRHDASYKHALFIEQPPNLMGTMMQGKSQLGWLIIHAKLS
jgi:hypothetical protein